MIIFDIGTGSKFLPKNITIDDQDIIYCFEPITELANKLKNTYKSNNFHIIQKAVCDFDDTVKFNIAGILDNNLSSLLNFSNNAFNCWPGRNDFVVTQQIKIETIRLDTFIKQAEKNIEQIDYISIDTNGCDVKVLNSMGNYISIVERGSMIASITPESTYAGQNSVSESVEFLKNNNFLIINVEQIDQYGNLAKIYFKKT